MKPTEKQIAEASMVYTAAKAVFGAENIPRIMVYMAGWCGADETRLDAWKAAQSPGKHTLEVSQSAIADPAMVEAIRKAVQESEGFSPHPGLARN